VSDQHSGPLALFISGGPYNLTTQSGGEVFEKTRKKKKKNQHRLPHKPAAKDEPSRNQEEMASYDDWDGAACLKDC
jgi:hypothetical protein